MDFGWESDAAAFLAEVEEDAAFDGDVFECCGELAAAIAAAGLEDVASQALGVDADEGGFFGVDLAACEGEVVAGIGGDAVEVAVEFAEVGGEFDGFLAEDEFFGAAAVFDELGDGAGFEVVALLVCAELADACHGSVVVHDFADDAGGGEFGEGCEVDGGFGVSGAAEDAAGHGLEREDVAGLDEGVGFRGGIGEEADGVGAVCGGDAGGDALCGIDGDGEGGFHAFAVAASHLGEVEFFGAFDGDGGADEAAGVDGHEVDHFGGAEGGSADEVGFVFAGRVIGDDDEAAGGDFCDDFVDGAEGERGIGHERVCGAGGAGIFAVVKGWGQSSIEVWLIGGCGEDAMEG